MLGVLAHIYRRFIDRRNRRFDDGTLPSQTLPARTIAIGNLTVGGTGKTPLVIKCAEMLSARGKRVCIISRGYGRRSKGRVLVSDGREIKADADTAGDEPLEIARRLGDRTVVISDADRVAAANWAKGEFGINVFILDDAFQHRQAARDVNILCIDATDPFGGEKLIPAGRLREPVEGLARADLIVITRADFAETAAIRSRIAEISPEKPIFEAKTVITRIRELNAGTTGPNAASIAHQKGFAFCGIGNPEHFFGLLERENYNLAGTRAFRDHHKFSSSDAAALQSEAKKLRASYFLTTAKDAVKLDKIPFKLPIFVVETSVKLDKEGQFASLL